VSQLADLIAEGGNLESSLLCNAPDVEEQFPVQVGSYGHIGNVQFAAFRNTEGSYSDGRDGGNARASER
jgi:hypothetical protein